MGYKTKPTSEWRRVCDNHLFRLPLILKDLNETDASGERYFATLRELYGAPQIDDRSLKCSERGGLNLSGFGCGRLGKFSAAALILPFFIAKLIFSKITEGKFSFRAIDTLIIYDGKGGFISFMMSRADFERVCRYMLKERRISPSKFQKQFVIFQ